MSLPPMGKDVPRPYRFRFGRCGRCGLELDYRTDNRTNVTETLAAGTDRPHVHAPAVEVSMDPDALADAIVRASRASRASRAERRQEQPQAPPPTPAPTTNGHAPKAPLGGIPEWDG